MDAVTGVVGAIAAILVGCQAVPPGELDAPGSEPELPGDLPPDVADPPPLLPDCSGLDQLIDLSGQIAANSNGQRGSYPVILAHGFMGFDQVGPLEYWNGAASALREAGFAAYVTAVEPVAPSPAVRAPELARQVACIALHAGADAVNIIGHSQGGLDARVVAHDPAVAGLVATVTTVATPHRGTLIADASLGLVPDVSHELLDAVGELFGELVGAPADDADLQASLRQLSVTHSAEFNAAYPDRPEVEYFSWSGRSVRNLLSFDYADDECASAVMGNPRDRDVIDPELSLTFEFLDLLSGPNDGLVAVTSGRWGTFMGCIPADHADQVGLFQIFDTDPISGFNHREFAVRIAEDLEARGF